MTIYYPDAAAWHDGILAMVERGLTFEAYTPETGRHHTYTINLTGGY